MQKIDYIILICVGFVFVLIAVLFFGNNSGFSLNKVYNESCQRLVSSGCNHETINSLIAYRNSTGNYTLGNICRMKGYLNSVECVNSCGCNVTGTGSTLSDTPIRSFSNRPVGQGVFITDAGEPA